MTIKVFIKELTEFCLCKASIVHLGVHLSWYRLVEPKLEVTLNIFFKKTIKVHNHIHSPIAKSPKEDASRIFIKTKVCNN